MLIQKLQNIEVNMDYLQKAFDFQSVYLRKDVNRDKAEWAIVGFQLELLVKYIFENDMKIEYFDRISLYIDKLRFKEIVGPDRGLRIRQTRNELKDKFGDNEKLSENLFLKRLDRIIWELACYYEVGDIIPNFQQLT
jgi:hypothetical protein